MAPKQLKFSSIISFLICPMGNLPLGQPIEFALDGDDAICGIDDEVMASTPLEILDDPFDAVEEDEESSIFAVSGSTWPRPSFSIGDLDDDCSFKILFSTKHDGLGLLDFLPFAFPRADLFG